MKVRMLALLLFTAANVIFSQNVLQQWVVGIDGNGSADYGYDITADNQGNCYVTGEIVQAANVLSDIVTIKYNSSGNVLWIKNNSSSGDLADRGKYIRLDGSGNIVVSGYSGEGNKNFITLKYDNNGNLLWSRMYDGGGAEDEPYALTTDNSNNIYVTGYSRIAVNQYDIFTIKYNPAGDTLWTKRYDSGTTLSEYGYSICLDNSGNVYIGGKVNSSPSQSILIKYNSSGAQQWIKTFPGNGFVKTLIDGSSNLNAVHQVTGAATILDIQLVKLRNSGDTIRTRRFPVAGNSIEDPVDMKPGPGDDIFIAGDLNFTNMAAIKYDSSGVLKWSKNYIGTPTSLIVDTYGNSYFTGISFQNFVTAKYNPLGDSVWRKDYDGSGNGFDKAFSISVNNSSEVFVTGTSSSSGVNYNILTLKYTQSPQTAPVNLTASGISNTKINLTWSDLNNNETGFKIERSTNGGINWTLKDSVPSASLNYTDSGLTMNTIYHYRIFSYNSQGISGYSNIAFDTTLNLTPVTMINSTAKEFKLSENYPNPFNPETNISFTVPVKTNVKITIYDIAGKEVSTVLNGIMIPGEHTIIFNGNALASGVYFYRMDAGYFYDVKKMILVK